MGRFGWQGRRQLAGAVGRHIGGWQCNSGREHAEANY